MPGFDMSGNKLPEAWDDTNLTDATQREWAAMLKNKFFLKIPYSGQYAIMPDPTRRVAGH